MKTNRIGQQTAKQNILKDDNMSKALGSTFSCSHIVLDKGNVEIDSFTIVHVDLVNHSSNVPVSVIASKHTKIASAVSRRLFGVALEVECEIMSRNVIEVKGLEQPGANAL